MIPTRKIHKLLKDYDSDDITLSVYCPNIWAIQTFIHFLTKIAYIIIMYHRWVWDQVTTKSQNVKYTQVQYKALTISYYKLIWNLPRHLLEFKEQPHKIWNLQFLKVISKPKYTVQTVTNMKITTLHPYNNTRPV